MNGTKCEEMQILEIIKWLSEWVFSKELKWNRFPRNTRVSKPAEELLTKIALDTWTLVLIVLMFSGAFRKT